MLDALPTDRRRHVKRLLAFREHSVGSLMEPGILTVVPEVTVAEV